MTELLTGKPLKQLDTTKLRISDQLPSGFMFELLKALGYSWPSDIVAQSLALAICNMDTTGQLVNIWAQFSHPQLDSEKGFIFPDEFMEIVAFVQDTKKIPAHSRVSNLSAGVQNDVFVTLFQYADTYRNLVSQKLLPQSEEEILQLCSILHKIFKQLSSERDRDTRNIIMTAIHQVLLSFITKGELRTLLAFNQEQFITEANKIIDSFLPVEENPLLKSSRD